MGMTSIGHCPYNVSLDSGEKLYAKSTDNIQLILNL